MNEVIVKETVTSFNSFDYIFTAYVLWQIYLGYTQGFRVVLYQTIKWVALFAALFAANKYLLPYMEKMPAFMERSAKVNGWFVDFVMQFKPSNDLTAIIFEEVVKSIPFDRIVFFLIVIVAVSIMLRILVMGTLWRDEVEGRAGGIMLGLLKAAFMCYVIMSFISTFMSVSNPEGFARWQESSFILSRVGIKF